VHPLLWYAKRSVRDWTCDAAPDEVLAFHAGLPGYAPTPLVELPELAEELSVARLFVKDESWRLGLPAFKVLGASWAIAHVVSARTGVSRPFTLDRLMGAMADSGLTLVTATDGNHGQAVARMAALLHISAHVFVPTVVSQATVARIASEGAEVTSVAGSYDEAVRWAARAVGGEPNSALLQDTAWPGYEVIPARIVEGYSTLLREVDAQLDEAKAGRPDLVAVPVGVGSLAQAVVTHYRSRSIDHHSAVLSVEPETAACLLDSLSAGVLRSITTAGTNMVGLNCGTPSSLAWPHLRDGLDAAVAVSDASATRAVADLGEMGLSSGPSGAATLAGVRAALTGPGSDVRRAEVGVDRDSLLVLLSTEGHRTAAVVDSRP
jgi:diaminopropionate ammonia-lyase